MQKTQAPGAIHLAWVLLVLAWAMVTAATLTSLFFSEVMEVPVCVLCWYQRIAMYPLVLVLGMALFPFDPRAARYGLALAAIGWLIALYHVLLVAGIVPENVQPCVQGIPCSETHLQLLGFLHIPGLSLLTFSMVGILLYYVPRVKST